MFGSCSCFVPSSIKTCLYVIVFDVSLCFIVFHSVSLCFIVFHCASLCFHVFSHKTCIEFGDFPMGHIYFMGMPTGHADTLIPGVGRRQWRFVVSTCRTIPKDDVYSIVKYIHTLHHITLHCITQHNIILHTCIQHNTIQYNTIQHNTIQYKPIQYNTIQ